MSSREPERSDFETLRPILSLDMKDELFESNKEKETKSMKYEKPEVQTVGSAISIVEHMGKGTSNIQDSQTTWESASAYEADE